MTEPDISPVLATARLAHKLGFCAHPAASDGSKKPLGKWEHRQTTRPSAADIETEFNGRSGIGIVCGAVSGGLEMFEFEGRAMHLIPAFMAALRNAGLADLWQRITTGYTEYTPSDGVHVLFKCPTPLGNVKLARRPSTPDELAANPQARTQVMIETRGEAGYTIIAPSNGATHPSGKAWTVASGGLATVVTITDEERDAIYTVARTLDEMPDITPPPVSGPPPRERDRSGPPSALDELDQAMTCHEVLLGAGFEQESENTKGTNYTRPGKDKKFGSSATVWKDDNTCTLFSSSIDAPEEFITGKRKLRASQAWTALHFNGDFKAAADAWRTAHPASTVVEGAVEEAFWTARPALTHIHTYARAQGVSPWATLGVVLARIVCQIPATVVLPKIVGGYASLNLAVNLVGPSGAGKGGAESVAPDAVRFEIKGFDEHTLGTGHGIAHAYGHYDKATKTVMRDADSVLFSIQEVDHLTGHSGMTGSTVLSEIRKFLMGEKLGSFYVDKEKRVEIGKHSYRGALVVGVQPGRAGVLLNDIDGGTPQRFLWLPVTDPDVPDIPPDTPAPMMWTLPRDVPADERPSGLRPIAVCDTAADAIRHARKEALRGRGNPLDGHALLVKERVAAALALLDGRYGITEDDWELAAIPMAVSNATRDAVGAHLAEATKRANKAKGHAEADRIEVMEDRQDMRVAHAIGITLEGHRDWMTGAVLKHTLASRDRAVFESAVMRLRQAGQIEVETVEYQGQSGARFRWI